MADTVAEATKDSKVAVTVHPAADNIIDLAAYNGSPAEKIKAAIAAIGVFVVGKTWCPFCLEVNRTFARLGVKSSIYNLDSHPEGGAVHSALKEAYKQTSVPYVFIGGEFIGGCDTIKALIAEGALEPKLRAAGVPPRTSLKARKMNNLGVLEGRSPIPMTLFNFPEAVDERVIRLTSFWSFVIALLCAIFFERDQAHWVMVGLMCDFVLRLCGGAAASPLGSFSIVLVAVMELFGSKPKWIAGPPKQFATLCGLMFAALASLFFLLEVYNEKTEYVGLAFSAALAGATGLEGVFGFCLGCLFFGWMVQFGLLPKNVYQNYTTVLPETEYTYNEMNQRLNEPVPEKHVRHIAGDDTPLSIDYKYKAKTDDYTKEDFNVIKHVKITHFLMIMGIAGLACAWKVATWYSGDVKAPTAVYYAIGLLAIFLFFIWLCLYAVKMVMYPQKVVKEWQCPLRGNSFVVPFVDFVLFAFLVADKDLTLAKVLFWIGAPAGLFLSFVKVGEWITVRRDLEHVNAAWIIMPVSNFVAAMVGPLLDDRYRDACQFWFGFAFISWMALFPVTFLKAITHKPDDDRIRPMLAVWVAAPAVMASAYLICYQEWAIAYAYALRNASVPLPSVAGPFNDFIFINLNWFAVGLSIVMLVGFYRPYFGRIKFDMSYWAAGFPSAALAIVTLFYNMVKPGGLSVGIAIACLAIASSINCTLALQTYAGILRFRVFTPDYKWGPLSLMRLTHEAFRGALPRLVEMAKAVKEAGAGADESLTEELSEAWRLMSMAHEEHAKHEDEAIFKTYNDFFPGVAKKFNDDHEHHHEIIKQIDELVAASCKAGGGATAATLVPLLEKYAAEMEQHLRGEEDHLQGMPRKYLPLKMHKQIVRKVWEITPAATWAEFIPWVLNSMPMLQQRVRFIKTLLWAMPERAQHIGIMVATGVDEVQWRRITAELPDIIPRGAAGFERFY